MVLTGPPGCQLSIPNNISMIWTDFREISTFFKKTAFWPFLVILANLMVFMRKCGFLLKIWTNRVWERKKWFEKVVSHYYHVFSSCIGRKIEIDEKVSFFIFPYHFPYYSLWRALEMVKSQNAQKSTFLKIQCGRQQRFKRLTFWRFGIVECFSRPRTHPRPILKAPLSFEAQL